MARKYGSGIEMNVCGACQNNYLQDCCNLQSSRGIVHKSCWSWQPIGLDSMFQFGCKWNRLVCKSLIREHDTGKGEIIEFLGLRLQCFVPSTVLFPWNKKGGLDVVWKGKISWNRDFFFFLLFFQLFFSAGKFVAWPNFEVIGSFVSSALAKSSP